MLQVPYFKQTTQLNCGAVALQMVLAFFGDKTNLDILEELIFFIIRVRKKSNRSKATNTKTLAIRKSSPNR